MLKATQGGKLHVVGGGEGDPRWENVVGGSEGDLRWEHVVGGDEVDPRLEHVVGGGEPSQDVSRSGCEP